MILRHTRSTRTDTLCPYTTLFRSFYACGVASSVYCTKDPAGSVMPDAVFSNIGKLLLATKIYDMHRVAHYVSGGLIVALPGPDRSEEHTSELQSLMRISYAVFCLNKKNSYHITSTDSAILYR